MSAYQVIARKWRPQTFDDVVGQDHVVRTLKNAIARNRIAHAYLFVGPRGTGKTSTARIFAKALNVTNGPKADFDVNDPIAQSIADGSCLDVIEIDGASNNGVEQVRELRDTVRYAPAQGKFKVYIIDEVHMLSTAAFNALLKPLEEPPAHAKFIFATTEVQKVLPTIISRCQRFDLKPIPTELIVQRLKKIAAAEKIKASDGALASIARMADGGMRDAESTLDQLISFCGDKIEEADVLSMFGLAAQKQILKLSEAVLAGEISVALAQLDELARGGKDLGRLLGDLLNHFRNLLIFQVSRGDLNLLEVSEAEVAALKEQSPLADSGALTRILEVLADAELRLRDTASKKILLEITALRAIEARNAVSLDAVLKQLNQLRGGQSSTGVSPVSPVAPTPKAAPAPAERRPRARLEPANPQPRAGTEASAPIPTPQTNLPAAPSETPPVSADLATLWAHLIEAVGRVSPFTRSYLVDANPVSFNKSILVIGFDPEFEDHLGLVDNARNHTLLQTKLAELGQPNCQIKFIKSEAPVGQVKPAPPAAVAPVATPAPAVPRPAAATAPAAEKKSAPVPFNKDTFKNDPLIQKALEVFKGQIVEVRA